MGEWMDEFHVQADLHLNAGGFMKYDSSIVWQMHDSGFLCIGVRQGGRVDDGNACCHQNQSVKRKRELNQVQSCALTLDRGRQAGSLRGRTAGK